MVSDYFPENLRLCRLQKGLRQEDMANELHITRQTYCNYENGQRMPSADIIVAIAAILDVSTDYLLCSKIQ